jgi:hypothetical protein
MSLRIGKQLSQLSHPNPTKPKSAKHNVRGARTSAMILIFACWGSPANAAACGSKEVTGLFAGIGKPPGGSMVDVTLNLLCANGVYTAQLFTSMGDFAVKDASSQSGRVKVNFDSGASLGTVDLKSSGNALDGSFDLAGDHGTVKLTRTGAPLGLDAMKPDMNLTPAQWHTDLHFLAEELPKRHANAFFALSRDAFAAEVAEFDRRIDTANADEIFVGFQQIVKSIGDGHTGLGTPPPDRRVMPIQFSKFGDDFRVSGVGPGLDRALGARLLKINDMPIVAVWRRVLTLTPQAELMELRQEDALIYLSRGYALHGLDITADRNHTDYTLEDDAGRVFTVGVQGLEAGKTAELKSGYSALALRYQKRDVAFWCKNLTGQDAVYCSWRAYQDLGANAKAMFALIDQTRPKKLVLDMRDNGGGDNTVGDSELVKPIKARSDLNAPGHLYVLIGPETFSAAMNNAAQFQDETSAILVGQTIGERPNSYQEPRQFRLPNSHLVVRASTLYYTFRKKGENAVRPNKEIIPSWDEVKAGRDPVMDWVLAQPIH